MAGEGLVKLVEECAELSKELSALQQIAAKQLLFPNRDDHPDGQGSLLERLENEMADVRAACLFVQEKLGLDGERMAKRAVEKLGQFREWDHGKD